MSFVCESLTVEIANILFEHRQFQKLFDEIILTRNIFLVEMTEDRNEISIKKIF